MKYEGDKYVKRFSCWNQLLVMMFGQLSNRNSLRDLTSTISAHSSKSYHLGFGKNITRSNLSKAKEKRDPEIFGDFAYHMIDIARRKRIVKDFEIEGKVYAFDSPIIDLCLSVFWWAKFRKTKAGIKLHTLFDIETLISAFVHVAPAKVHDMNAMDVIPYETGAYYDFDRGYFDLKRHNHITRIESYFVIREKSLLQHEVIKNQDTNHNANGILADQIIKLTGYASSRKYRGELRGVIYYAESLN